MSNFKGLAEQKLKSFSIGTMGKRGLSRKEQEEKKKQQEADEVGKVYKEFINTFDSDNNKEKVGKTWIKAGTFNAGNRKEDTSGKGQVYQPKWPHQSESKSGPKADPSSTPKRPDKPGKKKQNEKKKSNLEIFKEELKAMQEEREERHRHKAAIRSRRSSGGGSSHHHQQPPSPPASIAKDVPSAVTSQLYGDEKQNTDPNTTNLYLGNLSPKLSEQQLMELFGKFGPLASIKIMWPRTEDEKSRGRNCGFVAYMCRSDAERAYKVLGGKLVEGFEMKMGWGKPVPVPMHPIYVPPALLKLTQAPPTTGLPFNCQPKNKEEAEIWPGLSSTGQPVPMPVNEREIDRFNRIVHESKVKVVIPTDRTVLCLINRMVEFVIREGPMFEAMIMNREMSNRNFAFLFENRSAGHIYYRWRLFSMLQGDTKESWKTKEFRMFKGGSLWTPPPMNLYTSGMPEEFLGEQNEILKAREKKEEDESRNHHQQQRRKSRKEEEEEKIKMSKRGLSDSQRDRFEDMLRNLTPDRNPTAEAMVWCIEHADAGEEIVECIAESLSIPETPLAKKIARLYLISDVLHNCSVKGVPNVSYYRKGFQAKLPEIFTHLKIAHQSIDSRMRAEAFRQRVMNCFRAWEDWALYPQDFLIKMQNIFLGLIDHGSEAPEEKPERDEEESDVDGKSISEEEDEDEDDDVDGIPLDGAALLKRKKNENEDERVNSESNDEDVDGIPLTSVKNINKSGNKKKDLPAGFVPSKWETVNPEDVQAQAVTSKWDLFDQEENKKSDDDDVDGVPMREDNQVDMRLSEDRRARLREIELQVMHYQDELEAGKMSVRPGWTISEQVDQYRKKLQKLMPTSSSSVRSEDSRTPDTPRSSSSRRRNHHDDSDTEEEDHNNDNSRSRSSRKKAKKSRRSSSSSRSRSRSPAKRSSGGRRRRRSRSSSSERGSSSRHHSSRKHKKKRH